MAFLDFGARFECGNKQQFHAEFVILKMAFFNDHEDEVSSRGDTLVDTIRLLGSWPFPAGALYVEHSPTPWELLLLINDRFSVGLLY